ncbi:MAG: PAS domain S-box protein [Bdellovibrionales bacterium]|nr:PAS domain S-box protein [Bdellovibrionales bacterium]
MHSISKSSDQAMSWEDGQAFRISLSLSFFFGLACLLYTVFFLLLGFRALGFFVGCSGLVFGALHLLIGKWPQTIQLRLAVPCIGGTVILILDYCLGPNVSVAPFYCIVAVASMLVSGTHRLRHHAPALVSVLVLYGIGTWAPPFQLARFALDESLLMAMNTSIDLVSLVLVVLIVTRLRGNMAQLVVERETTVAELVERRDLERLLVQYMTDALVVIEPNGTVCFTNAALQKLLGYGTEEIMGQRVEMLMDAPDRQNHARYIKRYEADRKPRVVDQGPRRVIALHKSGSRVPISLSVNEFSHGSFRRYVGVLRDLSGDVRVEESARLASLGRLAAGIAHEVNSPLGALGLAIEMLESHPQSPDGAALLARMRKTVSGIASTIKSLKTLSRGSTSDPLVPCTAAQLLEPVVALCSSRCRKLGIDFRLPQGKIPYGFLGRSNDASQILANLVSNAIDAVKDLEHPWILVELDQMEGNFFVRVTDSGPGIPESLRPRLFISFFTTKAVGAGTGLGLSISRDFARAMGGDLSLDENSPNTRFVLKLQAHAPSNDQSS